MTAKARGARRNRIEYLLGYGQLGRFEGGGESFERFALIGGGFPLDWSAAVAAHGVDEVLTADCGGRSFHGIAMVHEDGDQRLLDCRHWRTVADGVLAEAVKRGAAEFH